MTLTKSKNDVSVTNLFGGGSKKIEMSIDTNAMSFVIDSLTSLYKDPIKSCVREVISNARDASVMVDADKQRPIEIALPSSLSPSFTVRDYGVGMSPDDVENIYAKYGGSTKRENFNQIGAFGLGAKSPLAYASSFYVETTKDGVTSKFNVSRESMTNVIDIVSESSTGEPDGTLIVIPSDVKDVSKFKEAVDQFMHLCSDVPMIVDGVPMDYCDDYIQVTEVVLDEETGLKGRVWCMTDSRPVYYALFEKNTQSLDFNYVLSDWLYSNPISYYNSSFTVELKPGVVDFESSRDGIIRNERSRDLHDRIQKQLVANIDQIRKNFLANVELKALRENARIKLGVSSVKVNDLEFTSDEFVLKNDEKVLERTFALKDFKVNSIFVSRGSFSYYADQSALGFNLISTKVTELKTYVRDGFVDDSKYLDLRHLAFNNSGLEKIVLIDSITDAKDVERILLDRPVLVKKSFDNTIFVLSKDAVSEGVVEFLRDYGFDVTRSTVAALSQEASAIRKSKRKSAPAVVTPSKTVRSVKVTDSLSIIDDCEFGYDKVSVTFDIDEIMKEKAVVVYSKNFNEANFMHCVYGILDSGVDIMGKAVYFIDTVYAKDLKKFGDYEFLFVNRYCPPSNNSTKYAELSSTRSVGGYRWSTSIKYIDKEVILGSFMDAYSSIIPDHKFLEGWPMSDATRLLIDMKKRTEGVGTKNKFTHSITNLINELPDDEGRVLKGLNDVVSKSNNHPSTFLIYNRRSSGRNDFDARHQAWLFDQYFAETLTTD